MKSNLEDLYLNIKQCILILLKNYTIWSHNLVLLLLKKRTLFSKIPAVSAHESKSSAAVPNFGRGFNLTETAPLLLRESFLCSAVGVRDAQLGQIISETAHLKSFSNTWF